MAQQALHTNPPTESSGFDWLDTIRGIITAPSATFARLADAQLWRQGLIFYLAVSVIGALIALLQPTAPTPADVDPEVARIMEVFGAPWFQAAVLLILAPLGLLALLGLIYQIGLRQGGDGPFARLFTTEIFNTATVSLVLLPVTLIVTLVQRSNADLGNSLNTAISVGFGIWGLVLTVLSIRASMRLSTGSAVGALIGGIIVLVIVVGLAFCLVGGFIVSMVG
jgi:hypothetical protein